MKNQSVAQISSTVPHISSAVPHIPSQEYDRILYDELGSGTNLSRLHQNDYASMR